MTLEPPQPQLTTTNYNNQFWLTKGIRKAIVSQIIQDSRRLSSIKPMQTWLLVSSSSNNNTPLPLPWIGDTTTTSDNDNTIDMVGDIPVSWILDTTNDTTTRSMVLALRLGTTPTINPQESSSPFAASSVGAPAPAKRVFTQGDQASGHQNPVPCNTITIYVKLVINWW